VTQLSVRRYAANVLMLLLLLLMLLQLQQLDSTDDAVFISAVM